MKINNLIINGLIFFVAMTSCKKNKISAPFNGPDIYVAGTSYSHNGKYLIATYWKNGVPTLLSDTSANSGAVSIMVQGNDIYVAGYTFSGALGVPTYWKNGVATSFGLNSGISGMFVSGNNVYLSGETASPHGFDAPFYWENGTLTHVTDGSYEAGTSAIAVNGSHVYLAGFTTINNGFPQAAVWDNGTLTILAPTTFTNNGYSGSSESQALGIFNPGTDVYAAGYVEPAKGPREACYWKNGTITKLSDTTNAGEAEAIFVQGNTVILAGYSTVLKGYTVFTYWKNGIETKIDDGYTSNGVAIAMNDSDIYVAGTTLIKNGATYWKNGSAVQLPGFNGAHSFSAASIAIVPHQ